MGQIKWTRLAFQDLDHIEAFISADSEFYARNFIQKIISSTEVLANFPMTGRIVPEFETPTIRELIIGNYRVVYRIRSKNVTIVRVHHSAQILSGKSLKD
jgi:toxin ParE1/3/4